ncbi:hypothetical protein F5Y19DRAFT_364020 [Xylariaceae sp. FL1651]|nr:hypothetical protein F5Y19DRAFT_364020 [Xylariaceae sp. FL1651]
MILNIRKGYKLLAQDLSRPSQRVLPSAALVVISLAVSTVLAFIIGRHSVSRAGNILSLSSQPTVFIYNRTFAESSSTADDLWESLFPQQHGFFTHPTIAPRRSTFSTYHTLHCLNGIRQGYWMAHDFATRGERLNESSIPMMLSPPHIRRCIDLLRQSLMCTADLTVEVKDESLLGVRGFGEQHECIDWSSLKDWTTKWESNKIAH